MINEEDRKLINELIYRKNKEVIEVMKKIPKGQLYSWKGEEKE